MNKKAISPLIASVLLIGFTVALAAVVMTWGGGFIRKTTEQTETSAATTLLCATTLNFDLKLDCTNNKVIVDNKGSIDIKELTFKIIKSDGTTETKSGGEIKAYDLKSIGQTLSGISKITGIAKIVSEGKEITCGDAPREINVNCAQPAA